MHHLTNWSATDNATWQALLEGALQSYRGEAAWNGAARDKSLGLLFFNPSLRTRTSMELAGAQLGAHVTTLVSGQGTWDFEWVDGVVMDGSAAEHIREAVGVLSRYYDALGVRVFASGEDYDADRQDIMLQKFVDCASVPVVNMESAFYHPCQALADAAALQEHFDGEAAGRKFVLTWTYHPKALPMAVPNSALQMAARLGMDVTVASPASHRLDPDVVEQARADAARHGTTVTETDDLEAAYDGASVVYAKAWGGPLLYSDPDKEARQRAAHRGWRVTAERMATTDAAAFMHCLPVRRNVVADDAVLDGPNAIHLLQAEMRLHAQKAILHRLWNGKA